MSWLSSEAGATWFCGRSAVGFAMVLLHELHTCLGLALNQVLLGFAVHLPWVLPWVFPRFCLVLTMVWTWCRCSLAVGNRKGCLAVTTDRCSAECGQTMYSAQQICMYYFKQQGYAALAFAPACSRTCRSNMEILVSLYDFASLSACSGSCFGS